MDRLDLASATGRVRLESVLESDTCSSSLALEVSHRIRHYEVLRRARLDDYSGKAVNVSSEAALENTMSSPLRETSKLDSRSRDS